MRLIWVFVVVAGCGRAHFDVWSPPAGDAGPDAIPIPDGLVAFYPMEGLVDPGGGTGRLIDRTGHGHDGFCMSVGTCPQGATGRIGNGLAFDGVDDLIEVPSTPELDTVDGFTVAVWAAIDAVPPAGEASCPTTKGLGGGVFNSWSICYYPTLQVYFYTVTGATTNYVTSIPTLTLGDWHHVAITWDGTTKQVALDGVVVATGTAAIDFDDMTVRIGLDLDSGATAAPFHGRVDDLRIYDRALDPTELATLAGR